MPTRLSELNYYGIYSITFTCFDWIPLIDIVAGYDIIYNWFDYLKLQGHYITGYVIMPNHVHVIIGFKKSAKTIGAVVGNGKRFIAYEIVKRLKNQGAIRLLEKLAIGVTPKQKTNSKKHAVWEISFDWKRCDTLDFIQQKLNYFHCNPCKGKWELCVSPVDYKHSSAKYYITGGAWVLSSN